MSQKLRVVSTAVTRSNGDVDKAITSLIELLGTGAKSRVQKWARAYRHLPKELQSELIRQGLSQCRPVSVPICLWLMQVRFCPTGVRVGQPLFDGLWC